MVLVGATTTRDLWLSHYRPDFSALAAELPPNVHLASVAAFEYEQHPGGAVLGVGGEAPVSLLVRLQHLFAAGEHPVLSRNVSVNILNLFSSKIYS
jgi:hypothetical protein